jgi:3-oxoacyl-(acyl-carrier-protein) synthase
MDRTSLLTTASARLALEDATIAVTEENRDRIGILLGTAFGATDVTVSVAGALSREGPASVNPILVPNTVMNAPAGHASIELGFRGVNTTVTHFGVSAENAIAYAVSEIRRGAADVMLPAARTFCRSSTTRRFRNSAACLRTTEAKKAPVRARPASTVTGPGWAAASAAWSRWRTGGGAARRLPVK